MSRLGSALPGPQTTQRQRGRCKSSSLGVKVPRLDPSNRGRRTCLPKATTASRLCTGPTVVGSKGSSAAAAVVPVGRKRACRPKRHLLLACPLKPADSTRHRSMRVGSRALASADHSAWQGRILMDQTMIRGVLWLPDPPFPCGRGSLLPRARRAAARCVRAHSNPRLALARRPSTHSPTRVPLPY